MKKEKKKICIFTGSRAEYGLLYWPMREIQASSQLQLQLLVTGMHLSPEFGLTYREIEKDGFSIDEKVEMLLSGDSPTSIAKSMGLASISFADAFQRLQPDLLLGLGDRFELFAAAQVALVMRIPMAHISGGDVTEGAFDESFRHSITKMSHLHFVTNALSEQRVRQLGEDPRWIFNVGNPGLDHLKKTPLWSFQALKSQLGIPLKKNFFLITFHPVTLEDNSSQKQAHELLEALKTLKQKCDKEKREVTFLFTQTNADSHGRIINHLLEQFVNEYPSSAYLFPSLGQRAYLSAMKHCQLVLGNSSSGMMEAPSFNKPTVNIGDRQKGRLKPNSVIDCLPNRDSILKAIDKALNMDLKGTVHPHLNPNSHPNPNPNSHSNSNSNSDPGSNPHPYGEGNSSQKICQILEEIPDYKILIKKKFYTLSETPYSHHDSHGKYKRPEHSSL